MEPQDCRARSGSNLRFPASSNLTKTFLVEGLWGAAPKPKSPEHENMAAPSHTQRRPKT